MITLEIETSNEISLEVEAGSGGGTYNYERLNHKPRINDVELKGNLASHELNIPSEDIYYTNEEHPEFENVKSALDDLIYNVYYVAPQIKSFVSNPSTLDYEIGTILNQIQFDWTTNKPLKSQTLTDCEIDKDDRTAIYSTPLKSNKTFTLVIKDEKNVAQASKTFRFMPKVYCGVSKIKEYDSDFVVGLGGTLKTSKAGTYTVTTHAEEYGYIAVPKSYGQIKIIKLGGFDTEMVDCGVIKVTNASGYTQDYYLCRTPQPNLGTISMVVS